MGEDQWWKPTIRNRLQVAIRINDFSLSYGKPYDINNPYQETISPNGTVIQAGKDFEFGTSGREDSPSGTEGTFDLVMDESGARIAKIYFDCPWSGSNRVNTQGHLDPSYAIAISFFNQTASGPLGTGVITIVSP